MSIVQRNLSQSLTMNLDDLRREAELKAVELEIDWERMTSFENKKYFEDALEAGTILIPDMERLYLKLTSGKSVIFDGKDSSLPYDEQEKYAEVVADKLFEAYVIKEILHKYRCITNILNLANPHDNPTTPNTLDNTGSIQLDLFHDKD